MDTMAQHISFLATDEPGGATSTAGGKRKCGEVVTSQSKHHFRFVGTVRWGEARLWRFTNRKIEETQWNVGFINRYLQAQGICSRFIVQQFNCSYSVFTASPIILQWHSTKINLLTSHSLPLMDSGRRKTWRSLLPPMAFADKTRASAVEEKRQQYTFARRARVVGVPQAGGLQRAGWNRLQPVYGGVALIKTRNTYCTVYSLSASTHTHTRRMWHRLQSLLPTGMRQSAVTSRIRRQRTRNVVMGGASCANRLCKVGDTKAHHTTHNNTPAAQMQYNDGAASTAVRSNTENRMATSSGYVQAPFAATGGRCKYVALGSISY